MGPATAFPPIFQATRPPYHCPQPHAVALHGDLLFILNGDVSQAARGNIKRWRCHIISTYSYSVAWFAQARPHGGGNSTGVDIDWATVLIVAGVTFTLLKRISE